MDSDSRGLTEADAGTGRLQIDLGAIAANYRTLRGIAGSAQCSAVVKADAYGLGVTEVAWTLERLGCSTFFVATLQEAIELRTVLPDVEILVLNGVTEAGLGHALLHRLIPVVNSLRGLDAWRDVDQTAERPLCVQTDTGMSRFGLPMTDVLELARDPNRIGRLRPRLLMSHLGCADMPEHPANRLQLERFRNHAKALQPVLGHVPLSLAASSGIFLGRDWHFDLIRPGAALFGISPGPERRLRQTVTLTAPCVQLRCIAAGEFVGYGATFRSPSNMRIATIACGYADGFLRSGSNRGAVAWRNALLPIVGLISMDSITVDATNRAADDLAVGDMVELIGAHRPLGRVAQDAGTIGYEILTALKHRARRDVIGEM